MSKFSKSAIDWAKLMKLVPPEQKGSFLAFKAKNDAYLRRVNAFPAEVPKIDWDKYEKEVPIKGLVQKFKSEYESFKVPYPEDKYSAEVDKQWQALQPEIKSFTDAMNNDIAKSQKEIARIEALPKFDNMTMEMFYQMFPEHRVDFVGKPSFWPHSEDEQLGYVDPTAKADSGH